MSKTQRTTLSLNIPKGVHKVTLVFDRPAATIMDITYEGKLQLHQRLMRTVRQFWAGKNDRASL